MTTPNPHPLDAFTTPMLRVALGTGAVAFGAAGIYLLTAQGDVGVGAALLLVAIADAAILVGATVRKSRAAQLVGEDGIIRPVDNRPPT